MLNLAELDDNDPHATPKAPKADPMSSDDLREIDSIAMRAALRIKNMASRTQLSARLNAAAKILRDAARDAKKGGK